jgi:tRNA threonylcarbamoyl adenosine modification protein YjeE
MRIYHADLYRIEDAAELGAIGMEEAWNPSDICLMEWAERAESWLPAERLLIQMRHLDETKRVLRFVPQGQRYRDLVETFKHTVFG